MSNNGLRTRWRNPEFARMHLRRVSSLVVKSAVANDPTRLHHTHAYEVYVHWNLGTSVSSRWVWNERQHEG